MKNFIIFILVAALAVSLYLNVKKPGTQITDEKIRMVEFGKDSIELLLTIPKDRMVQLNNNHIASILPSAMPQNLDNKAIDIEMKSMIATTFCDTCKTAADLGKGGFTPPRVMDPFYIKVMDVQQLLKKAVLNMNIKKASK